MSKGYPRASEDPKPYEIVGPAPAGSLASPGEDMAHFMIAHLSNGEYNGNRILGAATAEKMHDSPLTVLPPLNRMELGFFETNINGREVIAHLGDTESFHTSLHLFMKEGRWFLRFVQQPRQGRSRRPAARRIVRGLRRPLLSRSAGARHGRCENGRQPRRGADGQLGQLARLPVEFPGRARPGRPDQGRASMTRVSCYSAFPRPERCTASLGRVRAIRLARPRRP